MSASEPVAYISGPMTGYPDENRPAFKAAAELLRGWGWRVVSPDELDELDPVWIDKPTWAEYLRRDLKHLPYVNTCVLLPGWRASKGARLEVVILASLGCQVYELVGDDLMLVEPDRLPKITD